MGKLLYVMLIERGKTYNKIDKAMVERHVNHIRNLDDNNKLELCGVSKGFPGIGGMVILKAQSYEEAEEISGRNRWLLRAMQLINFLL